MSEVICAECAASGQPVRDCELCAEVTGCRHAMRKARVRIVGGEWHERIACEDWSACIMRCARKAIRGG